MCPFLAGAPGGFAADGPNIDRPLTPAAVIATYAALGDHRTGTQADLATADWLASQLSRSGFSARQLSFPVDVSEIDAAALTVNSQRLAVFPFWPPEFTGPEGISASLALYSQDTTPARDHIAVVDLDTGELEVHYEAHTLATQAAEAGATAMAIIIRHPIKALAAQNVSIDALLRPLPIPTIIAAEGDRQTLLEAAEKHQKGTLVLSGKTVPGEAVNVLASLDRGHQDWIVISTPISGWFRVANERGPGIALLLALARHLVKAEMGANVLLLGLSGHEIGKLGMRSLADSNELPAPDATRLWLHLGSGLALAEPLLSAVSYRDDLRPLAQRHLGTFDDMQFIDEAGMPRGSEQYLALGAGYPVVGLFGADATIHTPEDRKPAVDEARFYELAAALRALIADAVDAAPTASERRGHDEETSLE